MQGMLTYVVDTRDKFKFLNRKKHIKKLEKQLAENKASLSESEITNLTEIAKHKALANLYDNNYHLKF
jgi:hypothetical protein